MDQITIIGAGLAGAEAAYQLARLGVTVYLVEMRPSKYTEAHKTSLFGELVCSNSLRNESITNAHGLLKEELSLAGSLIMEAARANSLPAGGSLAVDREGFAKCITERITKSENIEVRIKEETALSNTDLTILATGPLTSNGMAHTLEKEAGSGGHLFFYDAIAPIIDSSTVNYNKAFFADRYDKGNGDYLNCPMNKDEYDSFYDALIEADSVQAREFESIKVFEGCMPVEVMARRGRDTLRFGPMKPVGIKVPNSESRAYAVLQLRAENINKSAFNMVGFQTRLRIPEQKRVFRMIPGLENVEFLRYGSIHRNTFVNAPETLNNDLSLKKKENILLAGQITGVEGYLESTAMGLLSAVFAFRKLKDLPPLFPSINTTHGALLNYITTPNPKGFQPSNINYSLLPALDEKTKDKVKRKEKIADRAIKEWRWFIERAYR